MTQKSYSIQKKYGSKALDLVRGIVEASSEPLYPMDIYNELCKHQTVVKMSTVYTSLLKLKIAGVVEQSELRGPYTSATKSEPPAPTPKVKEVDMALEKPDAEYLYICNHADSRVSVFPASDLLPLAAEEYFDNGDELIHVQVKCRKKVKLETVIKTRFVPAGEE